MRETLQSKLKHINSSNSELTKISWGYNEIDYNLAVEKGCVFYKVSDLATA